MNYNDVSIKSKGTITGQNTFDQLRDILRFCSIDEREVLLFLSFTFQKGFGDVR